MNAPVIGTMLNSALYLISVFVAGLVWQYHNTVILAVASMGVTYLSYFAQVLPAPPRIAILTLVGLSIVLGGGAGITLLMGV